MAPAYFQRAYTNNLSKTKDTLSIIADYSRAIELQPEYLVARWNRAQYLMAIGKNKEALNDFRLAYNYPKINEDEALYFPIANCEFENGLFEKAIISYSRALYLGGLAQWDIIEALRKRAYCYYQLKQYDCATDDFDDLIIKYKADEQRKLLFPTYSGLYSLELVAEDYLLRGICRESLGIDKSLEDFEKVISYNMYTDWANFQIGIHFLKAYETKGAVRPSNGITPTIITRDVNNLSKACLYLDKACSLKFQDACSLLKTKCN